MTLYVINYDCLGAWTVRACTTPADPLRFVGSSTGGFVHLYERRQECQLRFDSDALAIARAKVEAEKYSQVE